MGHNIELIEIRAVYALIVVIITYYTYYFAAFSQKTLLEFQKKYTPDQSAIKLFIFQKLLGFILLGPIAALFFFSFFNMSRFSIEFSPIIPSWLIMIVFIPIIIALSYFSTRKQEIYNRMPHMRLKLWNTANLLTSLIGWGLYILSYEFIFRELLLISWTEAFGVIPAITVNLALYSAFHITNGAKETIGSIFFGLILCLVSLQTGSFLMAFILHFTLSASTEMFSIYHNPEMQVKTKRTS